MPRQRQRQERIRLRARADYASGVSREVKIANLSTIVVGCPWRDLIFVELETDAGTVGVGEIRPVNKVETVVAAIHEFGKRYLVGADPFDVETFGWNMRRG